MIKERETISTCGYNYAEYTQSSISKQSDRSSVLFYIPLLECTIQTKPEFKK